MNQRVTNILFFILVGLLFAPAYYHFYTPKETIAPLNGTFENADTVRLSWNSWKNKSWQENAEQILKKNLTITPFLIRVQHEMDYRLFKKYNMADLLIGEDEYMFSWGWSNARCCLNNLNKDTLERYIQKLKTLSVLLNKKGKYFKIIIPPSKEEVFANKLPPDFRHEKLDNDYHLYTSALKHNALDYWDLLDYYKEVMDTSRFPIYSKTSVHWTFYGANLTLKLLIADMEKYFNTDMATTQIDEIEIAKFKNGDGDHEKTLNLFSLVDTSDFAYPKFSVQAKSQNVFKPKVLTIGDSFYWGMKGCWQLPKIYALDSKYLFYYNVVHYNGGSKKAHNIKTLNIVEEFKTSDAIVIINSSHNLNGYPFGLQHDIDKIITGLRELPDK